MSRASLVVTLTPDERALQVETGHRRQDASEGSPDRLPGTTDPREIHILGALREGAVACYHRVPIPQTVGTYHHQPDVAPDWEVRGTPYPCGHLLIYRHDPPGRYCLVTGDPPTLTLRGWLGRDEVQQQWWGNPWGRGLCWAIPQEALHPMPLPEWWLQLGCSHG